MWGSSGLRTDLIGIFTKCTTLGREMLALNIACSFMLVSGMRVSVIIFLTWGGAPKDNTENQAKSRL